jgi:DNA-binding transcriptional regulator PaaX
MSKNNLQEKILRILNRKKAVNESEISDFMAQNGPIEGKTPVKYQVSRILKNLHENGLIERHSTEQSSFAQITSDGRQKLRSIKLSSPTSLISTHWDGFWRMVILDIPESRKSERNSLRYILKKAGFAPLKNSVWVSPYPMEHLFMNIKEDMNLENEMTIVVTQHVDPKSQESLFELFGMK